MIVKRDTLVHKQEFGYKHFERKEAFSDTQLFPVASITKQFTAVGILHCMEQGWLELHQKLSYYLPINHSVWQSVMPTWASQITIHHLLTNSSGLPNYYLLALFNPDEWVDINNVAPNNLYVNIISKIKNIPLTFIPGSKFEYNDTNYFLLGMILAEIIPGHNLSNFYHQKIFQPLGLNNTIWPTLEDELRYIHNIYDDQQLPKRYTVNYTGNHQQKHEKPLLVNSHEVNVPCGGAGNMFSTAEDLLKWNYALHSAKILTKSSMQLMHKIHIATKESYYLGEVSYGYGLIINNIEGIDIYSHPGSYQGISTYLSYDPFNDIGIVILSNFSIAEAKGTQAIEHPGRIMFNLIENMHRALRS